MPRKKKPTPIYKKIPLLPLAIVVLMVIFLAFVGTQTMKSGSAARRTASKPVGFYLDPAASKVKRGSTLSVTLFGNSGAEAINVVQAKLQYPADKLEYLGISEGTAFPTVAATDVSTPGIIQVARGTEIGAAGISGSQAVVTLNFKVSPTASGNISLTFDSQNSYLVKASDNSNMLTGVSGATYRVVR